MFPHPKSGYKYMYEHSLVNQNLCTSHHEGESWTSSKLDAREPRAGMGEVFYEITMHDLTKTPINKKVDLGFYYNKYSSPWQCPGSEVTNTFSTPFVGCGQRCRQSQCCKLADNVLCKLNNMFHPYYADSSWRSVCRKQSQVLDSSIGSVSSRQYASVASGLPKLQIRPKFE